MFAEAALMAAENNLESGSVSDRTFSFMAFDPADDVEAKQISLRDHTVQSELCC